MKKNYETPAITTISLKMAEHFLSVSGDFIDIDNTPTDQSDVQKRRDSWSTSWE